MTPPPSPADHASDPVLDELGRRALVPVVVLDAPDQADPLAEALVAGGLPVAEVTFRTEAAAGAIEAMAKRGDILVGAGTALTPEQVDRAVDAGARFIVAPGTTPRVIERALARGVAVTPGIATPTELEQAMGLGLSVVKFFPAEAIGGVKLLKAIAAPYRGVRFVPTGGISADNLAAYLALPSVLACGGSWMVQRELVAQGRFDRVTELTREAVELARTLRP